MNRLFLVPLLLLSSSLVQAAIPLLNYTCPGGIEVHADEGGPVYINGKQARLKRFNDNYYEATGEGVTISISRNPDQSFSLSYTGKHGVNGICSDSSVLERGDGAP